ncbi:MAG: zinc ribbon domain-containing protein [Planctomycetaceae bacterium]|nr:zinc ribbon domain-containing protein [Planctomycetaceae bacterium]
MIGNFLGIFLTLSVAAGLFLLGLALAGRRVGIDVRCRRCRHQFPRTAEPPARCSDCGADLTRPDALVAGTWRLRRGLLAISLTLLVLMPAGIVALHMNSGGPQRLARPQATGALIDASAGGDATAAYDLQYLLGGAASNETEEAWRVATERFATDASVRKAICEAIVQIAYQSASAGATLHFAASTERQRAFGDALAALLTREPRAAEALFGDPMSSMGRLPVDIAEPVLASTAAKKAFLRGPKLRMTLDDEPRTRATRRGSPTEVRTVRLISTGFELFGRSLAFGEARAYYLRNDGTEVEVRSPFGRLRASGTFGTNIDIGAARADPAWNGQVRIRATVGTVAARELGAQIDGSEGVEEPFEHEWTIVFAAREAGEPTVIAAGGRMLTEWVGEKARDASVRVTGAGDESKVRIELGAMGRINGVIAAVRAELRQDGRTWSEPADFDPYTQGARPEFRAPGFDGARPFELRLTGVPRGPASEGPAQYAYVAGLWTVDFDRTGRPGRAVSFTAAADAQAIDREPEEFSVENDMGEVID